MSMPLFDIVNSVRLPPTETQIKQELSACIGCGECILACPAVTNPITIDTLNRQTIAGRITRDVAQFARACYQCGACLAPCPVGLSREAMMMWLKLRLVREEDQ